MLQELTIRNIAIIDDLTIRFSEGLTILTGETGAGKSIIINAVNLLLGGRASTELVRTGADSAELEALFRIKPETPTARVMAEYNLEFSEGLLIRRIISRHDKHRIYINGRLATAQLLAAVAENLACVSGQHAHQGLLREETHLLILDRFGGLVPLREQMTSCYREMLPLMEKLKALQRSQNHSQEQAALLEFQKNEIDKIAPAPEEDTVLEKERARLKHAEALYQAVHGSIQALYGEQGAVVEQLAGVLKALSSAGRIDSDLTPMITTLTDTQFQIEDAVAALRAYADRLQMDERLLENVEARIDVLNKLKRKYGGNLGAVFSHREAIEAELAGMETLTEDIAAIRVQLDEKYARTATLARSLSEKRTQAAVGFAVQVEKELADLKMRDTTFEVSLTQVPAGKNVDAYLKLGEALMDESGMDRATFMIAPNVGEALKPLSKIASGGELSRVMLALMAISAQSESVGLVVFDEVDAGIGGDVAEMVGEKMVKLAKYHQVLCITHLPQIARFGNHHYYIAKQVSKGRTHTTILPLDEPARMQEIARMLGGVTITAATLSHAREMLTKGST
ncbi:MAG: DNA repair protein RecN [Desulfobacterales bacterium]|jgi:DNA repair protein RecN (Recombination protein N)|nr:DNA repair protein RecN [Desulfobacterales bacterium]